MARWRGFEIWEGRWPHWRAEGVTYHVGFKHSRQLSPDECQDLFRALVAAQGKGLEYAALAVTPDRTDALAAIVGDRELSDIVEKAKSKAGKAIVKRTGERFPPFGRESYDRIMRDDDEFEAVFTQIVDVEAHLDSPEAAHDWPCLFVP